MVNNWSLETFTVPTCRIWNSSLALNNYKLREEIVRICYDYFWKVALNRPVVSINNFATVFPISYVDFLFSDRLLRALKKRKMPRKISFVLCFFLFFVFCFLKNLSARFERLSQQSFPNQMRGKWARLTAEGNGDRTTIFPVVCLWYPASPETEMPWILPSSDFLTRLNLKDHIFKSRRSSWTS